MIDSNAIRDAIGVIADEAHAPQRIQAVLAAAHRHHRRRRLVLQTAGVAATAAVTGTAGVGIYRLIQQDEPGFPAVAGGPGGGWLQAQPRWRPTWLPSGFGLTALGVVVGGDTALVASRTWTRPPRGNERRPPTISLTTGRHEAYGSVIGVVGDTSVDINGVPGRYFAFRDNNGGWLVWHPPGEPELTISISLFDADREQAVATQIAKVLQRDRSTIPVGPRPGWLPPPFDTAPWMFSLSSNENTWVQDVVFRTETVEMFVSIGPRAGQGVDIGDAQPVQVRGAEGLMQPDGTQLRVPLPDGTNVHFGTNAPAADLVRIAEEFDFGPAPDMTWYGSR